MPQIAPTEFKDGDALEPWHLNYIFRFIRRWSKLDAAPPLGIQNSGESPPLIYSMAGDELVPIQLPAGGIAAGSMAAPTSGTVTLLIEASDGPGLTASGADTATAYNLYTQAAAASKFGWAKWRGPYLYLVVWDC